MTKGQRIVLWLAVVVGLVVTFYTSGIDVHFVPRPPPGYHLDRLSGSITYYVLLDRVYVSFSMFDVSSLLLVSLTLTFVAAYLALRKQV